MKGSCVNKECLSTHHMQPNKKFSLRIASYLYKQNSCMQSYQLYTFSYLYNIIICIEGEATITPQHYVIQFLYIYIVNK